MVPFQADSFPNYTYFPTIIPRKLVENFAMPIFARPSLQRIVHNLCANPPVSVSLVGGPLMGKSSVLAHLAGELSTALGGDHPIVQINCAQIIPGKQPPTPPTKGVGWTVLLDNGDAIAQWNHEDQRQWAEWIASPQTARGLLLVSRRPVYEIGAEDGLAPGLPYFQQSFLGLIDDEEARRVIAAALSTYPESGPLADALAAWCGGHPFLLDRVADVLADVAGMLPGRQPLGPAHLPLLRLRLTAAYGRLLFESQWRAVESSDEPNQRPIAGLLQQLQRRGVPFDELSPNQAEAMNWLLVQGLAGIDSHSYRLFSPLLADFLALKQPAEQPVSRSIHPSPATGQRSARALIEQEAHRFTPQEKALLLYFLDRPGVIVSVEELLAQVWQRPDGSSRRVQEGIRRLRHRLTEFTESIGAIDNEWGQGYRYVPIDQTIS